MFYNYIQVNRDQYQTNILNFYQACFFLRIEKNIARIQYRSKNYRMISIVDNL